MRLSPGAVIAPLLLMSFLIPFLPAGTARSEVYRWTDSQGVLHFTDGPENVPPEFRNTPPAPKGTAGAGAAVSPPAGTPAGAKPDKDAAAPGETPEDASARQAPGDEKPGSYENALSTPDIPMDNFGRDETWWRDRRKFWDQRLVDAQRLHDDARRQFNRVNQRYDNREYKEMKLLRERMESLEREIARAQDMVGGGLAREARKAGAPPGWVR